MTPLGEKLRHMRSTRNVSLKEMAEGINVSSAYLSALEHGKKGKPGWDLLQRIISYLNVIWDEAEEIQRLAEISDPRVIIDTAGGDPKATELANILARNIGLLKKDSLSHILLEIRKAAVQDQK
ncbi:MAG: helix-turn-helix domain-containing protein [Cohaesibacteraceae bacterium]|nr:helix-turn-helix domain-containing protein [Cohaesibacteraceae bacterium]MBL4875947.1 helix-turn-helix domain-containing protein [Cohaesibacteraceae bacterium]